MAEENKLAEIKANANTAQGSSDLGRMIIAILIAGVVGGGIFYMKTTGGSPGDLLKEAKGFLAKAPENSFDINRFDAAVKRGQPVIIALTAPDCKTCAEQRQMLMTLLGDAAYLDVVYMEVDVSVSGDALAGTYFDRYHAATKPGTLIGFSGRTEAGRLRGKTDPAAVSALLQTITGQ